MEFSKYLNKMQQIEVSLINFLDDEEKSGKESQILNINFFEGLSSEDKKCILKEILHMILQIANNHHRSTDFYQKIFTILSNFKDEIKQSYSNYEIFTIFSENKCILSFLFKERILNFDEQFVELFKDKSYQFYLIHDIIGDENDNSDKRSLFEINKEKGENESVICQIIRKDSVEEFKEFVDKEKISISKTRIESSIFETNSFLIDKKPTLIEYAAFFGSLHIIQYLQSERVKLTSSLWIYAIHSNNKELIDFLEKNHVKPEDKSFQNCFEEAVKCHHNSLAKYIENNLLKKKRFSYSKIIQFYNYEFLKDIDAINYLNDFIECDYPEIVSILLKNNDFDINTKKILIKIIFYTIFIFVFYEIRNFLFFTKFHA